MNLFRINKDVLLRSLPQLHAVVSLKVDFFFFFFSESEPFREKSNIDFIHSTEK